MSTDQEARTPQNVNPPQPDPATASSAASSRVGSGFIVLFTLAAFGVNMAINTPAMVTLALRIGDVDPAGKNSSYALAAGIGTLVAVFANPLFGRLSDRTASRFGMRRPWMISGVLGTAVGAAVVGLSTGVTGIVIGWIIMQACVNAALASTFALLSDQVPAQQQGVLGGLLGMSVPASVIVGTYFVQLFPTQPLAQMGIPLLFALVFVGLLTARLDDRRLPREEQPPFSVREFFGSFWLNPRKAPDFAWYLLAALFIMCGIAVISTYLVYFLQDQLHIAEGELAAVSFRVTLVNQAASGIVAVLVGSLSDRLGRRKPFVALGAVLGAAGLLIMILGNSLPWAYVGGAVSGVAAGAIAGVNFAFALATLPGTANVARDLGLVNMAATLPYSFVPFAAPLLLGLGGGNNYPALFCTAAVLCLLGCLPLAKIRKAR